MLAHLPARSFFALAALVALALLVIASSGGGTARAAFPGANGKIAFVTTRDGNYEVYSMDADGNNQTRLTTNSDTDGGPDWSADGTQIAFYRESPNFPNPVNRDVYTMDADGSNEANLTNSIPLEFDPVWSPDGSKIAYYGAASGNGEIFVMNADGTMQSNLTNAPASDESQPAWSPDGTKIAFVTDRLGFPFHEIYTMNADGSNQTSITPSPGLVSSPDWSPDGSKISLAAFVGTFPSPGSDEVFVMDADGSNIQQLTSSAGADVQPAWSPDGSKIAFHSERDGNFEIYVMDADGDNETNISNDPGLDVSASWQPVSLDTDGDGLTDALEMQVFATDETDPDTDGDGCGDGSEPVYTPGAQLAGGHRNPLNSYDYFNPTNDGLNRIDDILAIVDRYFASGDATGPLNTIPPPAPAYHAKYDRELSGPNGWDLVQGNGMITVHDILHGVKHYFHDCGSGIVKLPP